VSREFKQQRTQIPINGVSIGGDQFVVMAGPCSVESEKQIHGAAEFVASVGGKILRGGAFKPRTSPYDFQGMEAGRAEAARQGACGHRPRHRHRGHERAGRGPLISEYADIVQVGARNMQNFALLKALGRCPRPVLLKRGMSSTIKELLMSAEYITAHGNPNVILCERGIRTFRDRHAQHLRYLCRAGAE
jgi:3-deoxy-7-phosphoheptulonate synthase